MFAVLWKHPGDEFVSFCFRQAGNRICVVQSTALRKRAKASAVALRGIQEENERETVVVVRKQNMLSRREEFVTPQGGTPGRRLSDSDHSTLHNRLNDELSIATKWF